MDEALGLGSNSVRTPKNVHCSWHSFLNCFIVCFFLGSLRQRPTGGLRTWDPETGNCLSLALLMSKAVLNILYPFPYFNVCVSAYLTRCDFNNNSRPFCDWTQPCNVNQGVWIRTKHDTPTDGTGPDGDYPDGSKCLFVVLLISFWRQPDYLSSFYFMKRFMKSFEMCQFGWHVSLAFHHAQSQVN